MRTVSNSRQTCELGSIFQDLAAFRHAQRSPHHFYPDIQLALMSRIAQRLIIAMPYYDADNVFGLHISMQDLAFWEVIVKLFCAKNTSFLCLHTLQYYCYIVILFLFFCV